MEKIKYSEDIEKQLYREHSTHKISKRNDTRMENFRA
jgi:hypothetical protein